MASPTLSKGLAASLVAFSLWKVFRKTTTATTRRAPDQGDGAVVESEELEMDKTQSLQQPKGCNLQTHDLQWYAAKKDIWSDRPVRPADMPAVDQKVSSKIRNKDINKQYFLSLMKLRNKLTYMVTQLYLDKKYDAAVELALQALGDQEMTQTGMLSVEARLNLQDTVARCLLKVGRRAEALPLLQVVSQARDVDSSSANLLAANFLRLGNSMQCFLTIQKCIAKASFNPYSWAILAESAAHFARVGNADDVGGGPSSPLSIGLSLAFICWRRVEELVSIEEDRGNLERFLFTGPGQQNLLQKSRAFLNQNKHHAVLYPDQDAQTSNGAFSEFVAHLAVLPRVDVASLQAFVRKYLSRCVDDSTRMTHSQRSNEAKE